MMAKGKGRWEVSQKHKLIHKLSCYESVPVVLEVDSRKFQYKVLENRREK